MHRVMIGFYALLFCFHVKASPKNRKITHTNRPYLEKRKDKFILSWGHMIRDLKRRHPKSPWSRLKASVFVNGEEQYKHIPLDKVQIEIPRVLGLQYDMYVVLKDGAKTVHRSEFVLSEALHGQVFA
ncbi:MAG: hypothetical protein AAGJ35_14575, partial [Myxococcota bacterium]